MLGGPVGGIEGEPVVVTRPFKIALSSVAVEESLRTCKAKGEELHAPALLRYEVANALAQQFCSALPEAFV
jgi:hypothetical protein